MNKRYVVFELSEVCSISNSSKSCILERVYIVKVAIIPRCLLRQLIDEVWLYFVDST